MKNLLTGDSEQRVPGKLSYSIRIAAMYLASGARTAAPLATAMGSLAIAHAVSADTLRDPTRPPDAQSAFVAPGSQPIRVEAILSSRERMLAIVNGKVVRAGDRIGDARIDEVMNDGIRYTRAGHSQIARLATHLVQVRQPSAPTKDES
jgi:MSHA biogenesis protein MshK